MINALPIVGWLISAILAVSISVPFWICWTVCGLGEKYFYWLPSVYHSIPFWHCVGLATILVILKAFFYPRFVEKKFKTPSLLKNIQVKATE